VTIQASSAVARRRPDTDRHRVLSTGNTCRRPKQKAAAWPGRSYKNPSATTRRGGRRQRLPDTSGRPALGQRHPGISQNHRLTLCALAVCTIWTNASLACRPAGQWHALGGCRGSARPPDEDHAIGQTGPNHTPTTVYHYPITCHITVASRYILPTDPGCCGLAGQADETRGCASAAVTAPRDRPEPRHRVVALRPESRQLKANLLLICKGPIRGPEDTSLSRP